MVIVATWAKCLDETRLGYLEKHLHPLLKSEQHLEKVDQSEETQEAGKQAEEDVEEELAEEEENEEAEEQEKDVEEEQEEAQEVQAPTSKFSSSKDDCFSGKTNRQIHLLLQKQGIFHQKPDLLEKSSKQSCEKDRESYREFASQLLKK